MAGEERTRMEAAPSVKMRRGSPPVPPNYVSLRQLQELHLKEKEEQEKRQREEEAAAAAAAAAAKREAARKAEMEAMVAVAAAKLEAARKAEMEALAAARKQESKVRGVVSLAPVRSKERRDGGVGPQWVAVAHRPAVPPPTRREDVPEAVSIGVSRGSKGPGDAPRGGGKPKGKVKGEGTEKVSTVTSAHARSADEPGKTAEDSLHGSKAENKGKGKGKAKAVSGDSSAESGSIGGSGESASAPYRRRRNNPKSKKGAGGRSAEPSADSAPAGATVAGASPPQGVKLKPEKSGEPKSLGPKRTDASPVSDSSHATPVPPTSAAAGVISEFRVIAETKSEGIVEVQHRPPAVEVQGAAERKPRVVSQRAWSRSHSDRCNGAGEQHGRMWVQRRLQAALSPEIARLDE